MISWSSFLLVAHLVGLALAVGAATTKLILLLKCRFDAAFVPIFLRVARLITRQIVLGLALLALSGIGWLLLGYSFTTLLVVKIVLVAAILALGPIIDNVVEPRFRQLAPAPGDAPAPAFTKIRGQYLLLELVATSLFYVIIFIWVLR